MFPGSRPMFAPHTLLIFPTERGVGVLALGGHAKRGGNHLGHAGLAIKPPAVLHWSHLAILWAVVATIKIRCCFHAILACFDLYKKQVGPGTRSSNPHRTRRPRDALIRRRPTRPAMSRGSSYRVCEITDSKIRSATITVTNPLPFARSDLRPTGSGHEPGR